MLGRTPWWSFMLVAVMVVIGLLGPLHGIGMRAYQSDMVEPGLVLINSDIGLQGVVGAGTGIVLSSDGEVLTNNHVVEGATQITATDSGTGHTYPASVVGYDRKHDIAVLQLQGASGLPTAPLGNSSQVRVGEPVLAIGNAGGRGLSRANGTVTATGQTIVATDKLAASEQLNGMIETNANIQPGDSGGPLVNGSGQIIGIDTAASDNYRVSSPSGAEGFAIPIDTALSIARQIESGSSSSSIHVGESAMLGVGVGPGLRGGGVPVREVLGGSPAEQVGIAPGDVITRFAGKTINSDTTLTDLLDQHYPGNVVSVTWLDQIGQPYNATVTLVPGPVG
jgi:S1-C subfamily serine protease